MRCVVSLSSCLYIFQKPEKLRWHTLHSRPNICYLCWQLPPRFVIVTKRNPRPLMCLCVMVRIRLKRTFELAKGNVLRPIRVYFGVCTVFGYVFFACLGVRVLWENIICIESIRMYIWLILNFEYCISFICARGQIFTRNWAVTYPGLKSAVRSEECDRYDWWFKRVRPKRLPAKTAARVGFFLFLSFLFSLLINFCVSSADNVIYFFRLRMFLGMTLLLGKGGRDLDKRCLRAALVWVLGSGTKLWEGDSPLPLLFLLIFFTKL